MAEFGIQFSTTKNTFANWASWAIRHFTHSPFSHVDLVLPDGTLLGSSDSPLAPVIKGNPRGVAIRPQNYEEYGYRRTMLLESTNEVVAGVLELAKSQIGKPFDPTAFDGFWSDALPTHLLGDGRDWKDTSAWFCSELVIWAMEEAGFWRHAPDVWPKNRVSPADIFMIVLFEPRWINRATFWNGLKAATPINLIVEPTKKIDQPIT